MNITYRWLGVAGLEFQLDGYSLLIDPFFTRPGKRALLAARRVGTDAHLVAQYVTAADAVLVTHPHYDHLLDVPEVLRQTGARAFGSPNTCALLALNGIPAEQVSCVNLGDRFELGPFEVEVFSARHTSIPFQRLLNGSLPKGLQRSLAGRPTWWSRKVQHAVLPLRLSDYRMDICYSFRILTGGQTLLVGNQPLPADVLFISPYAPENRLMETLTGIKPRVITPIHWDDFTRPLSRPLLPMPITPAQGLRPVFPPVRRMDLSVFIQTAKSILPGVEVRVPEIFTWYEIE